MLKKSININKDEDRYQHVLPLHLKSSSTYLFEASTDFDLQALFPAYLVYLSESLDCLVFYTTLLDL